MKTYNKSKLLAYMLAGSLLFNSGCSKADDSINNNYTFAVMSSELDSAMLSLDNITDRKANDYLSFFDNFEVNYRLEKYLIRDSELNSIIAAANAKKDCHLTFNGDFTILENKIEQNTLNYVSYHPEFKNYLSLSNNIDYQTKMYFKEALMTCLVSFDYHTNDINEDMHRFQTLKIVADEKPNIGDLETGRVLAYYDPKDNVIVIHINTLKQIIETNKIATSGYNYDLKTLITAVIGHELNHVSQSPCDCRKENDSLLYIYNTYVSLLVEASAESYLYNYNGHLELPNYDYNDFLYNDERQYESLLFLIVLLNKTNINQYYDAISDADLNSFFEFFNAYTIDEKKTLLKIIYEMDARFGRNDFKTDYYGRKSGEYIKKDIDLLLGFPHLSEICRISLGNMVRYTEENDDFPLEDNLIMLEIIKNAVVRESYVYDYTEDGKRIRVYDEEFVNEITTLVNKYYEYLAFKYDVSLSDLDELSRSVSTTVEDLDKYYAGDIKYVKDIDHVESLIKRFPLIKAIMYNAFYSKEYDDFIENSSKGIESSLSYGGK